MPRSTTQKPTANLDSTDAPTEAPTATDVPGPLAEPAKDANTAVPAEPPTEEDKTSAPEPDQHGRYRVLDADTGHKFTISAPGLPHGNFTVLDEPASDELTGQPLPPEYAEAPPESAVETTTDGL